MKFKIEDIILRQLEARVELRVEARIANPRQRENPRQWEHREKFCSIQYSDLYHFYGFFESIEFLKSNLFLLNGLMHIKIVIESVVDCFQGLEFHF